LKLKNVTFALSYGVENYAKQLFLISRYRMLLSLLL
jgi:hypothetical protein